MAYPPDPILIRGTPIVRSAAAPPPPPELRKRPTLADLSKSPKHAAKTKPGIVAAYLMLAVITVGALLALIRMSSSGTRVEHIYSDRQVSTIPGLLKILGKPKQIVDASQLGGKSGNPCYVYQPGSSLIVICP